MPERHEDELIPDSKQPEQWQFPYEPREELAPTEYDPVEFRPVRDKRLDSPEFAERVNAVYVATKKRLLEAYGIDNLTPIEAARLREIVKELLPVEEAERVQIEQGELSQYSLWHTEGTAISLWLDRMYGITFEGLPFEHQVFDETTGRVHVIDHHRWLRPGPSNESRTKRDSRHEDAYRQTYDEAHRIEKDLLAHGHKARVKFGITDAAKEYIRRKREEAHKP